MSKITQAKKEAKLKGKQAKIAAADSRKRQAEQLEPEKPAAKPSIPNYGKCCSCAYYGKPCHKTGAYVARKAENNCYKQKG